MGHRPCRRLSCSCKVFTFFVGAAPGYRATSPGALHRSPDKAIHMQLQDFRTSPSLFNFKARPSLLRVFMAIVCAHSQILRKLSLTVCVLRCSGTRRGLIQGSQVIVALGIMCTEPNHRQIIKPVMITFQKVSFSTGQRKAAA